MSDATIQLLKNGDIEYWTYGLNGSTHNLESAEEVLANLDGNTTFGITLRCGDNWFIGDDRTGISIESGSRNPILYLEVLDFIRGLHKLYQRWYYSTMIIDTKVPIASLPLRPGTILFEMIRIHGLNSHGAIATTPTVHGVQQQFYFDWSCCDPAIVASIDAFMHSIATESYIASELLD